MSTMTTQIPGDASTFVKLHPNNGDARQAVQKIQRLGEKRGISTVLPLQNTIHQEDVALIVWGSKQKLDTAYQNPDFIQELETIGETLSSYAIMH